VEFFFGKLITAGGENLLGMYRDWVAVKECRFEDM